MQKYCPKCETCFPEDWEECDVCGSELIPDWEYNLRTGKLQNNQSDHQSYVEYLKQNNPQPTKSKPTNIPKCPYCQSIDCKKISTTSRVLSFGLVGFASGKMGKQWHCNKCGSNL